MDANLPRPCSPGEALVEDGLMTVAEAATFLRVSRSTIYGLMDRGDLAFVKLGVSRRIPKRALIALAAAHLQGEPPEEANPDRVDAGGRE